MTFSGIQSSTPLSVHQIMTPSMFLLVDELRALTSQPLPIGPPWSFAALGTKPSEIFVLEGVEFGFKLLKFSNFVRISMA